MGYIIEYDRQFIVSKEGYTPLWLAGSNNCSQYNPVTGREVRERDWSFWNGLIGATEEEMLKAAQAFSDESDCWKRGGKWLDGAGVVSWVKSGMKAAVTLEDLLLANDISSISLCVEQHRDGKSSLFLDQTIRTTDQLDDWIADAKALREKLGKKDVYILCRSFIPVWRKLRKPTPARNKEKGLSDQVIISTGKGMYLQSVEYAPDKTRLRSCTSTAKKEEAWAMKREEAIALTNGLLRNFSFKSLNIVKYNNQAQDNNAIILMIMENMPPQLVTECTSRRLRYVSADHMNAAKHYSSMSSAKKAAANLAKKFPRIQFIPTTDTSNLSLA